MSRYVINEEFLQQVETLQSLLKNNVGGLFGGNRKSKLYGSSCEFADHRGYIPGDDITKIDWNVFARTDKLYQKLYLDERQMHTRIYIDASRSMEYGKTHKADQAIRMAATFAYLSLNEMDKVSVYVIRGTEIEEVISGMVGRDAYLVEIGKLNDIAFGGESMISDAIMPANIGRGDGLTVLISDFLTDRDYEDAIHYFTEKKRDLLCVQILSREEINPQSRGKMHFFDSEDTEKTYRKNIDREIARAYKEALKYATERLRGYCNARGAEYMLVADDESVVDVFFGKLVDMGVLK